jgi:hypothetical protein
MSKESDRDPSSLLNVQEINQVQHARTITSERDVYSGSQGVKSWLASSRNSNSYMMYQSFIMK